MRSNFLFVRSEDPQTLCDLRSIQPGPVASLACDATSLKRRPTRNTRSRDACGT